MVVAHVEQSSIIVLGFADVNRNGGIADSWAPPIKRFEIAR